MKKSRKEIKETNEALDVDMVDLTVKGIKFGAKVASGVASIDGAGKKTKFFGVIGDTILGKSKSKDSEALPPASEQIDAD